MVQPMGAAEARVPTPPPAEWIDRADAALRGAGYRASAPRAAVLELIAAQECVLSAREIADELRAGGREVGVATVYRTLELLEELRLVQRLDIGGTSARFEPALPDGMHHHHHLVCERCGRVTPFDDPGLERAIDDLGKRVDYVVADHDVILRGRCPACVRAAP